MCQSTYSRSYTTQEDIMATRSYRSVADTAKAQWSTETHELSARLGAELAAEVDAQVKLGRDLAQMRGAAALTQEQLAARASVQQAEISRIERGFGNPTRDTLIRLAAAVGARVALVPVAAPATQPQSAVAAH
jgi:DNA-binding XRE family transcriptional regulator